VRDGQLRDASKGRSKALEEAEGGGKLCLQAHEEILCVEVVQRSLQGLCARRGWTTHSAFAYAHASFSVPTEEGCEDVGLAFEAFPLLHRDGQTRVDCQTSLLSSARQGLLHARGPAAAGQRVIVATDGTGDGLAHEVNEASRDSRAAHVQEAHMLVVHHGSVLSAPPLHNTHSLRDFTNFSPLLSNVSGGACIE
jgi:hypothetical protein